MSRSSGLRGNLTLGVVITLLAVIAGLLYFIFREEVHYRKFTGTVVGTQGDMLILHGVFYAPREKDGQASADPQDFTVRIGQDTQFSKVELRRFTPEEIMARGGSYKLSELPRIETDGSFPDLAQSAARADVFVEAEFTQGPDGGPAATFVTYRVMLPPAFPTSTTSN